jgi:hypothetical protein
MVPFVLTRTIILAVTCILLLSLLLLLLIFLVVFVMLLMFLLVVFVMLLMFLNLEGVGRSHVHRVGTAFADAYTRVTLRPVLAMCISTVYPLAFSQSQ